MISVLLISSFYGLRSTLYVLRDSVQATQYRKHLLAHIETNAQESAGLDKFLNSVLQVCKRPGDKFFIGGKSSNFTDDAWKEYQSSYVERVKTSLINSRRSCEHDAIFVKNGTLKSVSEPHNPNLIFAGSGEMSLNDGDAVSFAGFFWLEIEFNLRSGTPEDMIISSWSFKDYVPEKVK